MLEGFLLFSSHVTSQLKLADCTNTFHYLFTVSIRVDVLIFAGQILVHMAVLGAGLTHVRTSF